MELGSLVEEKKLLNELKIKVKNFKDTKENNYLAYTKEVFGMMTDLVDRVNVIVPGEEYY